MGSFSGFITGTRSVPVPAPLLGPLLEAITDMAELKCTLRFLWLVHQRRGWPRMVRASDLLKDPGLRAALGSAEAVQRGVDLAVERGTLLASAGADGEPVYLLHTPENRRAAQPLGPPPGREAAPWGDADGEPPREERLNIFTLYEENIGMLTPLIADDLQDAERQYPWGWIEAAFREAVERNKRSWRYIARILERQATEGRGHGESGRHPEALTAAEYLLRRRGYS